MLLVGESFYFPHGSTIHLDADAWYGGRQENLSATETGYMNCRELLESEWKASGNMMYRELNRGLSALNLEYNDRPISHVAFTNAFARPAAKRGESFKHCCTSIDWEKSVEITDQVIKILKPELVVYTSKFSADKVSWKVAELNPTVDFRFTAHPASGGRYWTKDGYPHGRPKFSKILNEQFIRSGAIL